MATRIPLPPGWGEASLHEPGEHRSKTGCMTRSYDHLGRQLVWSPAASVARDSVAGYQAARFACDIEDGSRVCADMATGFGVSEHEFRRRWVVTEVLAKLHDVPILAWLKQCGLSEEDCNGARVWVREWPATGGVMAFAMLNRMGEIKI